MKDNDKERNVTSRAVANQVIQKKHTGHSLPAVQPIQMDPEDEELPPAEVEGGYQKYISPKYNADYQPAGGTGYQALGAAGPLPRIPDGRDVKHEGAKYSDLRKLGDDDVAYDKEVQKPQHAPARMDSKTLYATSEEDKARYTASFKGGKLMGSEGAIDTMGNHQAGALGSKGGQNIFTMSESGNISTADAVGETLRREKMARDNDQTVQDRIHHSTFSAGGEVAAAGELAVRKGQVESFSDVSGHYRPGSKQMHNMASELESQGAGIEKISAEFVDKDKEGSKDGRMKANALEVLGWGGGKDGDKENIEGNIRAMHGKKDEVMKELLKKKKS